MSHAVWTSEFSDDSHILPKIKCTPFIRFRFNFLKHEYNLIKVN